MPNRVVKIVQVVSSVEQLRFFAQHWRCSGQFRTPDSLQVSCGGVSEKDEFRTAQY